jgi:diguanylate cyclase (GGDEF)-like protein
MASSLQYEVFRFLSPLAIAVLAMLLASSFRKKRRDRAAVRVFSMFAAVTIGYLATNYLELTASSEGASLFWAKALYVFIAPMPVVWLDFCLKFARDGRGLGKAGYAAALAVPLATMAIIFTPGLSGLMWSRVEFFRAGPYLVSAREHGPWFAVYAFYTYGFFLAGGAVAARAFEHLRRFYSRQAAWVMAGIAVPLGTSLVYVLRLVPGLVKDYTPLGYAIAAMLFYAALFRRDLFSLAPVGRDQVVERLAEGILVLDAKGRLADVNPAAMRMLGLAEGSVGRALTEGPAPPEADFLEAIGSSEPADVRVGEGALARSYRVEHSAFAGGRIVVVTDQTDLRALIARVETLAMSDELTGLPNRRRFLSEGERELARARRRGLSLAAAMIDFDDFKSINDNRGHAAGDAVLREFGAIVAKEARAEDVTGRIGGDEFAILAACGPGPAGIRVLCERLRRRLAITDIRDEWGAAVRATISAGIAVRAAESLAGLDRLLADADAALYEAKRRGRDAIAVFGEE